MKPTSRVNQYLDRYVHTDSRNAAKWCIRDRNTPFKHIISIPAFDEEQDFLKRLGQHPHIDRTLIILVLNAPHSAEKSAQRRTTDLLHRLKKKVAATSQNQHAFLLEQRTPTASYAVLVMDHCSRGRELPDNQGVGLARKLANDVALELWLNGLVQSP